MQHVKLGQTCLTDAPAAARDFHQQVAQPGMGLVLFFCSSHYDLPALAEAMVTCFGDVPVIGCTTAGELGPQGYQDNSLSGASFPADSFFASSLCIQDLKKTKLNQIQRQTRDLEARHKDSKAETFTNSFALLLVDGVSQCEDALTRVIHNTMPTMPLLGGSAGDDLDFRQTLVFHQGEFHRDSAVLVLLSTSCPVAAIKSQHFAATDQRLVVTGAAPHKRLVTEINGLPAASEYARLTGVDEKDLNLMRFASSPVVVMINGKEYVRSIQQANPDGSLTFYSAIEEGLVFRVAHGVDLLNNLTTSLQQACADIGKPQVLLAFDCVLRKLELEQTGDKPQASELIKQYRTIGFNSYGEQYSGVHVNQTFTGMAIGSPTGDL
ncbi:FIST N-terminal domain-containing protein [Lacimicrobium alkaliphilum]|uniref:FIST domain containing protein n=1 Tax=Lacimicrobium alkaliphilum TaxID=1526571 RepID=A0A0U3B5A0_9ALTE|nr:FIST N-terminal domain-containing protein [Lacimicrobium alkaliphilum]ALS96837.1 FIST domain containing protein [Lacimicrobium alkaliphilum]